MRTTYVIAGFALSLNLVCQAAPNVAAIPVESFLAYVLSVGIKAEREQT